MGLEEIKEELSKSDPFCNGWCAPDECLCVSRDMLDSVRWLVSEVDKLKTRNDAWNKKFHDYCESQLDAFRKSGMIAAADRCAEIAEESTVYQTSPFNPIYADGESPAEAIRREFGL